jgi:hypothetical protein
MVGGLVDVQYSSGGSPYLYHEHTFKGEEDEIRGWTA